MLVQSINLCMVYNIIYTLVWFFRKLKMQGYIFLFLGLLVKILLNVKLQSEEWKQFGWNLAKNQYFDSMLKQV
jgi:hypothetical protein